MKFEAIIFDLDGTLLNTLEDIANSANAMLRRHGFPTHVLDDYRRVLGNGIEITITKSLPPENRGAETLAACLKTFREYYDRNWHVLTKPYAGVPELLQALAKKSLKTAVLSNKKHEFTVRCMQAFFPNHPFAAILGHQEGGALKPDPQGALQIAEKLNILPEHFLFLGDTQTDMQTALAARMFPVGALWGFREKKDLLQSGAKAVIEHPLELLEWL